MSAPVDDNDLLAAGIADHVKAGKADREWVGKADHESVLVAATSHVGALVEMSRASDDAAAANGSVYVSAAVAKERDDRSEAIAALDCEVASATDRAMLCADPATQRETVDLYVRQKASERTVAMSLSRWTSSRIGRGRSIAHIGRRAAV